MRWVQVARGLSTATARPPSCAQYPTPEGPQPVPYPPNALAWQLYVAFALPLAIALPMAWLVLPSPAGRLARACLARALRTLGQLGSGAVELMLADGSGTAPAPGSAAAAAAAADGGAASAPGGAVGASPQAAGVQQAPPAGDSAALPAQLLQADADVRQGARPVMRSHACCSYMLCRGRAQKRLSPSIADAPPRARGPPPADLGKADKLLGLARLEVDVYRRPRRLPVPPYRRAAALAAACVTGLAPLVRRLLRNAGTPGEAGVALPPSAPLELSVCQALAPQLRGLQAAVAACCDALAGVVEQQQPFHGALACLAELETAWAALDAAALPAVVAAGGRAAVNFRMVRGYLCLVVSRVRRRRPQRL